MIFHTQTIILVFLLQFICRIISIFDPLLEAVALADLETVKILLDYETRNPQVVTNYPGVYVNRKEKTFNVGENIKIEIKELKAINNIKSLFN